MTDYTHSDEYEDMAATFQVHMLHYLNDALRQAGITVPAQRREICTLFGFNFGIWKDQYWFKDTEGNRVFPCIAFSTNGPATDKTGDLGKVYLPSSMFSFHEYLHGALCANVDETLDPSEISVEGGG